MQEENFNLKKELIFYKILDTTKNFLISIDKEYNINKSNIINVHKYTLQHIDTNFSILKQKFNKNYHIFLTDSNFTIKKTTFKYDKNFSLLFLKDYFISHKNINVSYPVCEPATSEFISFSDSYQNQKVLQIGYIYHSKEVIKLKKILKNIKKQNPFIKDIIIYFVQPNIKFAQKCEILNPLHRKYTLKEMKKARQNGLNLYKKLKKQNPIFTKNNMFILANNPFNYKNNIILRIDLNPSYYETKLKNSKYIFIFVFLTIFIVMLIVFIFLHKILDYIEEFSNHIKNETEYNKKFNNEFDEVIKSYNHTLNKLKTLLSQKKEFLEFAVHELKTPLSIISLNIDDNNEIVKSSIKMLTNSYNDMVYYLEFNKSIQNIKPINLQKLLLNRIEYFRETLFLENKKIIDDIDKLCINADILDIERLIDNNITNAIKHSTSDIIYIKLKNHILTFENDGDISDKEKIFEKFYTTKGFGIGLSIITNITKKYKIKLTLKTDKKIIFEYNLKEIIC